MAYLWTSVWGPAEFVGRPPGRLVREGFLAGVLGAGAIVATTLFGAWTGWPSLADGEAGLVCAGALGVYLSLVGAGRALIGSVALLGVCLALQAPQAAAGMVLAERGQAQFAVVTAVEDDRAAEGGRARYLCSVADTDGVPLKVRIWRGCGEATRPGARFPSCPIRRGGCPREARSRGPTCWDVARPGPVGHNPRSRDPARSRPVVPAVQASRDSDPVRSW